MSFTMWRGVVGMVRPTRRPGATEEIIRMLPEGIGVLPFMVNFRAGGPGRNSRTRSRITSDTSRSSPRRGWT